MVVQHNLSAMNSNRMLGVTQKTLASSTEKLSSGYRINRAADDAAGLSISEKMRKQIRGLDQASANAEDGISSVQTAEGALQEVTDMLQRMNELAVQAANGTNSVTDRGYIQDEIDQLVTEIDRVAETTKFNETYLLKGDESKGKTKVYTTNYAVTYTVNSGTNSGTVSHNVNYTGKANIYFVNAASIKDSNPSMPITADVIRTGDDVTKYLDKSEEGQNGTLKKGNVNPTYTIMKNVDVSGLTVGSAAASGKTLQLADGKITAQHNAFILNTETNTIIKVASGEDLSDYMDLADNKTSVTMKEKFRMLDEVLISAGGDANVLGATLGSDIVDPTNVNATDTNIIIDKEFKLDESRKKLYDADGKEVSGIALNKYFDENGEYTGGLFNTAQATTAVKNDKDVTGTDAAAKAQKISTYITKNYAEVTENLSFSLQVGADSARTNKIVADIDSMSAAALGVNKLLSTSVGIVDETGDNATDAIDVIAKAIQQVSTQRSALGAIQNRLEHTIKNLDNIVENTTRAESQIRDTDMASEMVKYSNTNILSQAGQSMLAQANQSNQGILSLIG